MKKNKNWQRYALEWGVLAALIVLISGIINTGGRINPDAYCPFGGIQAFANYVSHGSLPCDMSSIQIISGIALIVAVVLFSKLFCAYLCPLGTVSGLLMNLRNRLGIPQISIPTEGLPDKILRAVKYCLLFVILYATMTTGELLCKKFDPYYAIATGFNGEITIWISIGMLLLLVLGSFIIDNFWCKYICPLGALSNTFKYWLWIVSVLGVVFIVGSFTKQIPIWCIIALLCIMGYLLEVFSPRAPFQVIYIQRDKILCDECKACEEKCPYHINITKFDGAVEDVNCMLCGECIASCPSKSLNVSFSKKRPPKRYYKYIPALLTISIVAVSILLGQSFEIPTINETWGANYTKEFKTFSLDGLNQVHCYASSKSFMKKLQQVKGVYGVKTYVQHHRAEILYNPSETTPEKIQQSLFVSSKFQISVPDHNSVPELRVITIRTENMTGSNASNLLGLQFKKLDSLIYGLKIDWDIPLIVNMYVHPSFNKDENWISEVVNMPYLEFSNPQSGKTTKITLDFEFIRMEQSDSTTKTIDFLNEMFKPFRAEFKPVSEVDPSYDQYLYEIPEKNVTKPVMTRNLSLLASYLSEKDGIGAIYSCLNDDYVPTLVIRYYHPMTEDELYSLLSAAEWRIRDKDGTRLIHAPFRYINKGKVRKIQQSKD